MKFKEYIKFKNYIILLSIAIVILAHLGTIRGRSGVDFEVRGAKSAILPQRDFHFFAPVFDRHFHCPLFGW
jgi:hypothetical protein